MNFLRPEIDVLERLAPGLLHELDEIPFSQKESQSKPALDICRRTNVPGLIIPKELGGLGATPVEAVRFQRALGAAAPSAALATNMHHFTVALLHDFAAHSPQIRYLLKSTAANNWYLASGFAEGSSGQSTLLPTMIAKAHEAGYVLDGSKKPCSLSHSMDIFTASVRIATEREADRFGVAIIPANSEGLTVKSFWSTSILAGAESDEVNLKNVYVTAQNMFLPGNNVDYAAMQSRSFLWFQLLTSSCYLGIGSALLRQLLERRKGSSAGRVDVACDLEGGMAMLEGVAHSLQAGDCSEAIVARALFARYAVQEMLIRTTGRAAEMLGGITFISSERVAYLASAVRCLAFHPPSKAAVIASLDTFLSGGAFAFV